MTTDELTTTRPSDKDWAEAFHNYQREVEAYASNSAEYDAACRAVDQECPDREDEFIAYGLNWPMDRDTALEVVDRFIERRDHSDKNGELADEVIDRDAEEAGAIVEDYFDYRAKRHAAFERLYKPAEKKHDKAVERRWTATNKLLDTPAPDADALLFKLDLLASIMGEHEVEDAPHVASIREDARRLLGRA